MANFSDYYENKIIDHMLRAQAFSPPATVYVALFTGDPATVKTALEANNPTTEVDTSGTAYGRKAIALDEAGSGTHDDGETANTSDITFDEATASWGTVTCLALVDHETNDTWGSNVNVLMFNELTDSKAVGTGDTFKLPAGDVEISVD